MEELEKLKIQRAPKTKPYLTSRSRRKRLLPAIGLVIGAAVIYLVFAGAFNQGIEVEIETVSVAYPSQEYTLFNATGYVVPQTKADIASKATGRLEALEVEEGSYVKRGDIIVEADVSESNLTQVRVDQPCEIQLDALPGERFRGRVHMIVPTVDRTKATILVKVRFVDQDERILPDMSARVAFLAKELSPTERKPHTVVEASAIVMNKGQAHVFRIKEDTAQKIPVTVGKRLNEKIIVHQGLSTGDKVVTNPSGKLRDGTHIELPETG